MKKTHQIEERNFESNINQIGAELYAIGQKIEVLNRERDVLASDSDDRIKLDLKRTELEIRQKKHKKMQAYFVPVIAFDIFCCTEVDV